jgi:hypothetical protein
MPFAAADVRVLERERGLFHIQDDMEVFPLPRVGDGKRKNAGLGIAETRGIEDAAVECDVEQATLAGDSGKESLAAKRGVALAEINEAACKGN